jgi:diguanylate cyclase
VALRSSIRTIAWETARVGAIGLPLAMAASLALTYGLLLAGGMDGLERLIVLALVLPAVVALPLLAWVAVERSRATRARQSLNRMQSRDPVTGFLHAAVMAGIVDRREVHDRRGGAFLVVDAGALARVNLAYGFEWHDEALRHVAGAIRAAVRAGDLVGRAGPDSFAVFLAGAEADDALAVGERIREAVAASYFAPAGVRQMLDVIVGGVVFEAAPTMQELYVQAMRTLERGGRATPIVLTNLRPEALPA